MESLLAVLLKGVFSLKGRLGKESGERSEKQGYPSE